MALRPIPNINADDNGPVWTPLYYKKIKTFKASLFSSEKHFIFNNVLLMNRRLALKVFMIDKETSGKWIIKNKALVPSQALRTLF